MGYATLMINEDIKNSLDELRKQLGTRTYGETIKYLIYFYQKIEVE